MTDAQVEYYHEMVERNRGLIIMKDGHVAAVVTYLIGDNDARYLYRRTPWTIIADDPKGSTVYIDQLIIKTKGAHRIIHKEFSKVLNIIKRDFPNVKRAKWLRVGAAFRKHGIKEGVTPHVHCKDIK